MVQVCVNYADFLKITLPLSKNQFDKIIVVTAPHDKKTIKVCNNNNVECVITDRMYEDKNDILNKGKGLNEGIKKLQKKDWLLITDTDIAFPSNTRSIINKYVEDKDTIYCAGRRFCLNRQEWKNYCKNNLVIKTWVKQAGWKTAGLGFFQLVNFDAPLIKQKTEKEIWYTETIGHCGGSDRKFRREWEMNKRAKFPWKEFCVIHLGTPEENWTGRKSPIFK